MNKSTVLIPVALFLFLAAAVMIWRGLQSEDGRSAAVTPAAVPSTEAAIVVANAAVEPGHVLTAADVSLQSRGTARMPAGALRRVADAEGHAVLSKIGAGAPVTLAAISGAAVSGISPRVPVGYRAFSIPVAEAAIAGGFLQANDHVDLYVTLPGGLFGQEALGGRTDDQSKSTLLLQDVTVLAVGTKLQGNGDADTGARTVTLALQPDVLSKVALAARVGTISLAIRNPADQGVPADQSATLGTLVGKENPPPVRAPVRSAAAAAQTGGIIVYTGKDRSVLHVP